MTTDTHNPTPDKAANPKDAPDSFEGDVLQAAPLAPGAALGSHTISRVLVTSDSGYTYLANDGATVVQEYFPLQFAVRDTDNTSLLLCDAQFNTDYEQGLTEFLRLARVATDRRARLGPAVRRRTRRHRRFPDSVQCVPGDPVGSKPGPSAEILSDLARSPY